LSPAPSPFVHDLNSKLDALGVGVLVLETYFACSSHL